jgi:LysM repeat protein
MMMTKRLALSTVLWLAACGGATAPSVEDTVELARATVTDEPMLVDDTDAVVQVDVEVLGVAPAVAPVTDAAASYRLRRGETLAHFARWSGLPVETIAEVSGLSLGGQYPVGTEVSVPLAGVDLGVLEQRREEHRTRRVEGYLAGRGGSSGTEFYVVKTGDSAWSIAHADHGMPVWLLEAYNPLVDLDRLRPGQELMLPVLADTVAAVE